MEVSTLLDIYSAQANVNKLLSYVEELADTKPRMYNKSRDRLKQVADTCSQVVSVISEILQEEVLKEEETVEFEDKRPDIANELELMQSAILKIKEFTGLDIDDVVHRNESEDCPTTSKSSSSSKKKAIKNYRDCLSKLSLANIEYRPAGECAKLLWTWYDVRFLKTSAGSSFRYNMKFFPKWVTAIVMLYGKHLKDGSIKLFEDDFHRWIESLYTTEAKDKFAVPYEVYQFCKSTDPLEYTLDGVVLWDILLDAGLRDICVHDELYLDEHSAYDMCSSYNSSALDNYSDYHDGSVFEHLNWKG